MWMMAVALGEQIGLAALVVLAWILFCLWAAGLAGGNDKNRGE